MNGLGEDWMSMIMFVDMYLYINYDIVLIYVEGEDEMFFEGGFVEGGKVWFDCWVFGEESGGNGCLDDGGELSLLLLVLVMFVIILVGLSVVLLVKCDD